MMVALATGSLLLGALFIAFTLFQQVSVAADSYYQATSVELSAGVFLIAAKD